jgi:hypothetical protein
MKQRRSGEIAALVLASRGGARLRHTLDSIAWIESRIVVDPRGSIARESLPAGVRLAAMPPEDHPAGEWVFLLSEGETASPALGTAIGAVLRMPEAVGAYRVRREIAAFGATLRPRLAPVRLLRGSIPDIRLRAGGGVELAHHVGATEPVRTLGPTLCVRLADSLAGAVDDLSADALALATLLRARGRRAAAWHFVVPPLVTAARFLVAPGSGSFLARWGITVIAGYSALVAYGTLWERAYADGVETGAATRP